MRSVFIDRVQAVAAALIVALLVPASAAEAAAQTSDSASPSAISTAWTRPVRFDAPLSIGADGSITWNAACVFLGSSSDRPAAQRLDRAGAPIWTVPYDEEGDFTCLQSGPYPVDRRGTTYWPSVDIDGRSAVVAWGADGSQRWRRPLHAATSVRSTASDLTVGPDGNVYVIDTTADPVQSHLVGLSGDDGHVLFRELLVDQFNPREVRAFSDGLVLVSSKVVEYRAFNGARLHRYALPIDAGGNDISYRTGYWEDGSVVVTKADLWCHGGEKLIKVVFGRGVVYSGVGNPELRCAGVLEPLPNGGIVTDVGDSSGLTAFGPDGAPIWSSALEKGHGGYDPWIRSATVDVGGHIAVVGHATLPCESYYGACTATQIEIWDSNSGDLLAGPYFYERTAEAKNVSPGDSTAFDEGRFYTNIYADDYQLLAVDVPGLGRDYPNSLLVDQMPFEPPPAEEAVYVALGDSYSAGEGVPPFDKGTNKRSAPTNVCHRSQRAYPKILSGSPLFPENLEHWACSGAVIPNFYPRQDGNVGSQWYPSGGQWGEDPQLQTLERYGDRTDIVTLSLGGNDVGFGDVLEHCVRYFVNDCNKQLNKPVRVEIRKLETGQEPSCIPQLDPKLPPLCFPSAPRLRDLYMDVHRAAPNAKVVVVGYPRMFDRAKGKACVVMELPQRKRVSAADKRWLNRMAMLLNSKIESEVRAARRRGVDIVYVDVAERFRDHGLCSDDEWIQRAAASITTVTPAGARMKLSAHSYSFHPTWIGQLRYAQIIRDALEQ